MSAFLCTPHHIGRLARWYADKRPGHSGDPEEYATVLAMGNIDSIVARYTDTGDGDGACQAFANLSRRDYLKECIDNAQAQDAQDLTTIEVLKACDCLEYQSCEDGHYFTSDAFRLLSWIRKQAVDDLPGYKDANGWELEEQ